MATLLELNTIEVNSLGDAASADPNVIAARALRAKVRTAILKRANTILQTALPDDETRSDALERLAWAQQVVRAPDSVAGEVFRLTIANNAAATPATILGATDVAIEAAVAPVLAALAKGKRPGA